VLSGEIVALMDEGECLLQGRRRAVQAAPTTAGATDDQPAYLAFVLIDAEPVPDGGQVTCGSEGQGMMNGVTSWRSA